MKSQITSNKRRVVAVSGKHSIAIAIDWPEEEREGLLGFAIRRTNPNRSTEWLKTALRFEGDSVEKGRLYDSSEAPIQSMIWTDFALSEDKTAKGLIPGSRYTYEIIPVRGQPNDLQLANKDSVRIAICTEPEHEKALDTPEVHFNRGYSSMQEYERLFGEGHEPNGDPKAQDWLTRHLKTAVLDFIHEAVEDPTLQLDVAAYHLDDFAVIKAISKVGSRARVSLDWGAEERQDEPGPNAPALEQLKKAGVTVHKREHISISHNKYIVLKDSNGKGKAVLTGSTNFSQGGLTTQSNQSLIIRNPQLAEAYLADFERVLKNDNEGLREANKQSSRIDDTLEVFFSPHSSSNRPDLDQLSQIAKKATSNRLFITFRMTDTALVQSILDDSKPAFGVVDRVYRGKEDSGDRLIFNEAHEPDPRVVACNAPLDDEPDEGVLFKELKRQGYDPLVHHKILLFDWNTPDCVVVTGSANYSTNSTAHNDENSLIVYGDQRLAEEYFVEFCKLYTHWRPRWMLERNPHNTHSVEHLSGDDSWIKIWAQGGKPAEFLALALGSDQKKETTALPSPQEKSLAGERIEHVVVLMLENRSFDQMLGQLEGVDGVPLGKNGINAGHVNYLDPQNPTKETAFPVRKAKYFSIPEGDIPPPKSENGQFKEVYGGPSHSFPSASLQVYNDSWGPQGSGARKTTPTINCGFIKSYDASLRRTYEDWTKLDPKFKAPENPLWEHLSVVMASFTPEQLPVINGLAQEFCVCDKWFSEVPGPTEPNRLFMHAGTSTGFIHNPWEHPIEARTIYEDLEEQGERDWAFYYFDLSDSDNFLQLKKRHDCVHHFDSFYEDLKNPSTFPNYSFLCPRYLDSEEGFANSQHAPYDVRYGEHLIADVYEALRKSEIWEKTLLVVTYDEHGGFYDHVPPPDEYILPPDAFSSPTSYDKQKYEYMFDKSGRPKRQYQFDFDRLGARVPTILISPWIAKGVVESEQLQHTSVLATLRKIWGLRKQPLTAREGQAQTFDGVLEQLSEPRKDCPMTLERPQLPKHSLKASLDQPLSPVQREVFAQVNHLDGHEDSGTIAPLPQTQREAAQYVAERRKAHQKYHKDKSGSFTIYKDSSGQCRWRLINGETGEIVASSGQGFSNLQEVKKEIDKVRRSAAFATVETES